ncbi:MAG: WG repeat-containing protein [Bacteroidia bacterium]|nr:WG repeat-containing protein [Bacteroidia bacterium]
MRIADKHIISSFAVDVAYYEFLSKSIKCWKDKKVGLYSKTGEEILPCEYDNIRNFHEDIVAVCKNDEWAFVSQEGTFITGFEI